MQGPTPTSQLVLFLAFLSAVPFSQWTIADAGPATKPSPAVVLSEFIYETAPFPSVHATTIAETKAGLVAAFFGGTREGNSDVCIYVSRHDGKSWYPPQIAADGVQTDTKKTYPCWNPVLHAAKEGSLVLFYKVGPSPGAWWGMAKRSIDGGKSWSDAWRLPEGILGPIKNKAVILDDGSILCPSSTEDAGWRIHMEFTADLGHTFARTAALNGPKTFGLIQPTIIRHDGKLIALCRSKGLGKIVSLESADQGKTWSEPMPTDLPNPNSGIDAVTLSDRRSVLVYNHTPKGRSPLNIAVTGDGKNWNAAIELETEKGEFSYPAVIQTSDGMIHITYTWKRQKVKHVVVDPKKL